MKSAASIRTRRGEIVMLSDAQVLARLSPNDRNVIRGLADGGMQVSVAAESAGYTRNAVYYRITKIMRRTGLNCRDYYDLTELLRILATEDGYRAEDR